MDGNTALGASSPAKPAFTRPEPLSHTRAVVSSSSHMVSGFCKDGKAKEALSVSGKRPPSPGTYGHLRPPASSPLRGAILRGKQSKPRRRASLLGALLRGDHRERFSTWELRTHGPESSLPSLQAPPSLPLPGVAWGSRSANPDFWATVRVEGDAVERAWAFHQGTNGLFWTSMTLQTHSPSALGTDGERGEFLLLPFGSVGKELRGGLKQNLSSTSALTKCQGELPQRAGNKSGDLFQGPLFPVSSLEHTALTPRPEARLSGRGVGADAVSGRALPGDPWTPAAGPVLLSPPRPCLPGRVATPAALRLRSRSPWEGSETSPGAVRCGGRSSPCSGFI